MFIQKAYYRTIWFKDENTDTVCVIDQRHLPHKFEIEEIVSVKEMVVAIKDMHVRGAGLIGAAAGFGMYLAVVEAQDTNNFEKNFDAAWRELIESRPTAVNLRSAVLRQLQALEKISDIEEKKKTARKIAIEIADEDADYCKRLGEYGVSIIESISKKKKGETVNILTHCNAGWLAFVDYGSATAPIYEAHRKGINIHVWVDETRPRNQGASLTAFELLNAGVPHTVIADNTGGHLMQHGLVDMVITGADRVTRSGDAANKIGTYLKALAAKDNNIPFYVAMPSTTFDWSITDGVKEIPIEERGEDEVKYITGLCNDELKTVLVTPLGSKAANYGFDVTPARLISNFITERGIIEANEKSILKFYPEQELK